MVSDRVVLELKAEAAKLRRQADLIDEFLRGVSDAAHNESALGQAGKSHENGSFSSHIRNALTAIGRTVTSRQVAEHLIVLGTGPERNGKPLRNAVAVELFRMSKKGTGGVQKVSRGRYRIVRAGQEAG